LIRATVAVICALWLSACASAPPQSVAIAPMVKVGEEFTLALGEAAFVVDMGSIVVFHSVHEDSRCAVGTTCVWEGNARLALLIREAWPLDGKAGPPNDTRLELNTSERFPQKLGFGKHVVELRRLEPVPSVGAQTTMYKATLLVSPNE
jgi:hypothetical protein